jgi:hypothetical protein
MVLFSAHDLIAAGSTGSVSTPVELMIFLLKKIVILEHQFLDVANLSCRHAFISGQPDRLKPKFTFAVRSFNMDMGRFNSFI